MREKGGERRENKTSKRLNVRKEGVGEEVWSADLRNKSFPLETAGGLRFGGGC